MSAETEIKERYLAWTVLHRSCELAVLAEELGDQTLAALFRTAAQRAAARIGASSTLIERIQRIIAQSWRSRSS